MGGEFILAVQWHPGMMADRSSEMLLLFKKIISAAEEARISNR
ncbi:MAG: hypothetical protein H6Q68_567 [Firmicutes bacterium]|nr:hypothetical protein [Bacillota bacterium]